MEWVNPAVTVVVGLAAAWLGARVGANATLAATVVSLDHELRMRGHDRTLEAAERFLDLLAEDVYTYRDPRATRPTALAGEEVRRPLMQASYSLANRAHGQDAALTDLCHEYAGVLGREATQADVFTANRVMSGAVTEWVREREKFLSLAWTFRQHHNAAHENAVARTPPTPLLSHPLWITPGAGHGLADEPTPGRG